MCTRYLVNSGDLESFANGSSGFYNEITRKIDIRSGFLKVRWCLFMNYRNMWIWEPLKYRIIKINWQKDRRMMIIILSQEEI